MGIRLSNAAKRLQREAYKAWLAGLVFNTIAGAYTLFQLSEREQSLDRKEGEGVVEIKKLERYLYSLLLLLTFPFPPRAVLFSFFREALFLCSSLTGEPAARRERIRERTATYIQLVSDLCDLTIPSTALGYVTLDDGFVGLAGTLSSLIGVWTMWRKTA